MHRLPHIAARLFGAMLILVATAMPAAASNPHAAAHLVSTVNATEHHHHDEHGAVVADHHHHGDHDPAPASDDADGHDHMPVQLLVFDAPPPPDTASAAIRVAIVRTAIGHQRAPPNLGPAPPNRPPRSA